MRFQKSDESKGFLIARTEIRHPRPPQVLPHPYAFNLFSHNTSIDRDTGYNGEESKVMAETRKIFADRSETNPLSAIQITTAAGICAAVDLFREGRLPQRGFIRQEQVALPDFLANRFGSAYQQSRQVESIG